MIIKYKHIDYLLNSPFMTFLLKNNVTFRINADPEEFKYDIDLFLSLMGLMTKYQWKEISNTKHLNKK